MIYIKNASHQYYDNTLPASERENRDWPWEYGLEGENTIALGSGIYWGHMNSDDKTHTFKEWEVIISDWRSSNGECGRPQFVNEIKIPSTGLQRSFYMHAEPSPGNNRNDNVIKIKVAPSKRKN